MDAGSGIGVPAKMGNETEASPPRIVAPGFKEGG
jgi:hypothetical protein